MPWKCHNQRQICQQPMTWWGGGHLENWLIILISNYMSDQADFFAWDIKLFESSDGDVATSHIGAIAAILNIDFDIS